MGPLRALQGQRLSGESRKLATEHNRQGGTGCGWERAASQRLRPRERSEKGRETGDRRNRASKGSDRTGSPGDQGRPPSRQRTPACDRGHRATATCTRQRNRQARQPPRNTQEEAAKLRMPPAAPQRRTAKTRHTAATRQGHHRRRQ